MQRELGRLVEAEIVYQRGLPPQATYTFKHALIQDAAYQSLLRSTRQQYHQRLAQVLAERFPETSEALLSAKFSWSNSRGSRFQASRGEICATFNVPRGAPESLSNGEQSLDFTYYEQAINRF